MGTIPLLAAWVKEASQGVWTVVSAGTLTNWLELPEFEVTHFEQEGEVLHLKCEHRGEIAPCPRCGELSTEVHDCTEREVRDLSLCGKAVVLHFDGQRFGCESCGRPFSERLVSIVPRRRQTRRYERQVYEQCLVSDRKAVAEREQLSASTVQDIFVKWAKRATRCLLDRPVRVLGIDELALKKRHQQYVLVVSDLERHCIIAILPDRKKEGLVAWLKQLPDAERRTIRVVSTDLWEPYRQAVREALPEAHQVAGRFHVMKQLNERLNQARRRLQRQVDAPTRQVLKGSRWLLVKTRAELLPPEQAKLQAVLDASPDLRTMYLLKEEFRLICDKAADRQQGARFLRAWIWKVRASANPWLLKFVDKLTHWWEEFLNYFST